MDDYISRQAAIDALKKDMASLDHIIKGMSANDVRLDAYVSQRNQVNYDIYTINNLPAAQPEPCEDADKLKRCRFEYINACKIVTYPTPDTSKNDIYDAHAVIKALHPIFGDEDFKKTERKDALQKSYAEGKTDD